MSVSPTQKDKAVDIPFKPKVTNKFDSADYFLAKAF
jgi:hypothetical protein